ncbi:unnamed protein product [Rhizophagus irregularis]|nr:unnamed protein product [Rhizophagus irregularis]
MSTKNNNNNTGGLPKFRIKRVNNNEDNNTLQKFYKKNKSSAVVGLPKFKISKDFERSTKKLDLAPQSEAEFLVNLLEAPQPETLITKLLPYQKQGLGWMLSNEHPKEPTIDEEVQFWIQKEDQSKKTRYYNTIARFATIARPNLNRGGILADDMGLGKTIQMIALIASKPAINLDSTYSKTTLIVTPLSVLDNWVDQINIHVKKGSLSYYVFHGINRNNDPEFLKDHDIIITTYAILAQSDIKERSGLLAIKWLRVILDEGHIICTKSSKQSIAACNLDAERRWILTGTPIMNELNDMYSLIKFLRFTPFDNFETWNTIFNNKTMKFKNNNNSRLNDLRNLMKTVCLCRTKDMKFNEHPIVCLPPINFYTHKIKFKTDEKKIYDKMESDTKEQFRSWKESRNGDLKNNYVTFLEMLLRLRQICNHTQLLCKRQINQINGIDNKEEIGNLNDFKISSKIEALVEFLNQNNDDDKSVVFSQWTSFLDLIEIAFKDANVKFVRFDGKMFRNQREEAVNNFNNDPEIKVLLISLKCGSLGLNLTAANQCFLMDPWWNPSIEDQAIDRIYRIGQTRPVSVFRIFIENTIEDRVFELQKKKRDLIFQAFKEQQSNESSNIDEAQLKKDLQVLLGEN